MEELSNNTPVNLFFAGAGSNNSKDGKSDKSSEAYIILQNDILHEKYDSILKELNELRTEHDDLETDNDRLQKSKTCLQGYVKNEFFRASEYRKQNKMYKNALKLSTKYSNISNAMAFIYGCVPLILGSVYVSAGFLSMTFVFHIYVIRKYEYEMKSILDKKTLLKSQREINDIEKSSKMIEDIVDNI